jgi:hypothetical protein
MMYLKASPAFTGSITVAGTINGQTIDGVANLLAGTINGQTISSAANFTGTLVTADAATITNTLMVFRSATSSFAQIIARVGTAGNTRNGTFTQYGSTSATTPDDLEIATAGDLRLTPIGLDTIITGRLTVSDNVGLVAAKKLYLDGVAMSGDTYITESSANVLALVSGGVTTSLTSGVLSVGGFGIHTFSAGGTGPNAIRLRNSTAGTGNYAEITVGNDSSAVRSYWEMFSTTYTPTGPTLADGMLLEADGAGGISIVAGHASGALRFYSGGSTLRSSFLSGGQLLVGNISAAVLFGLQTNSFTAATYAGIVLDETANTSATNYAVFSQAGTAIGSIQRVGSTAVVAYNTTSDRRLKDDLGPATDLTGLRGLQVRDFAWKSDGTVDRNVFAQDAYAVLQRGVTPGTDGDDLSKPWQIEKAAYVPDLIVGWQQHDAELAALRAELAALSSRLEGGR